MAYRGGIVSAVLVFVAALAVAGVGGCNIHELGHLVTGRALGVPVDHITWCTPANGRIAFSYQEPAFVSYAGGVTAALALGAVYGLLIWPRLAAPLWRAAGVAVLGTAVSQVFVGVMEGASPQGYAQRPGECMGSCSGAGPAVDCRGRHPAAFGAVGDTRRLMLRTPSGWRRTVPPCPWRRSSSG